MHNYFVAMGCGYWATTVACVMGDGLAMVVACATMPMVVTMVMSYVTMTTACVAVALACVAAVAAVVPVAVVACLVVVVTCVVAVAACVVAMPMAIRFAGGATRGRRGHAVLGQRVRDSGNR